MEEIGVRPFAICKTHVNIKSILRIVHRLRSSIKA